MTKKILILLIFLCIIPLSIAQQDNQCEEDRSCCSDKWDFICFRNDKDKSIRDPVQLVDLSTNEEAKWDGKGMSYMHYPGSVYKVDRDGMNDFKAGIGRTRLLGYGTIGVLARLDCGIVQDYQWRPDRVAWSCRTSHNFATDGERDTQIEVYPYDEFSWIVRFRAKCSYEENSCNVNLIHWTNENKKSFTTIKGFKGFQNDFTVSSEKLGKFRNSFYVVSDIEPDSSSNDKLTWSLKSGEQKDVTVFITDKNNYEIIDKVLNDPEKHITQARKRWHDWFDMFQYPSECDSDWCRERYYRAIYNHMYNLYKANPQSDSMWSDNYVVSPGANYDGVWIWDSFFATWGAVNTCKTKDCVQNFMDSLRVLIDNKFSGGQWSREVWYNHRGAGWQAPGGWSFAVDQADKIFVTNEFSKEFYEELKDYHEWIRKNADNDGDQIFEWQGTNSGWDGSRRWEDGKGTEAIDLNSWMLLDAESLKNMAQRLGKTSDASTWNSRIKKYKSNIENMCKSDFCYDHSITGSKSNIKSAAGLMTLISDGISKSKADNFIKEIYNKNTLGGIDSSGLGILPTISRDSNGFAECGSPTWSGQQWMNININLYMGLQRYGMTKDAEFLKSASMLTLKKAGIGYESYCSRSGLRSDQGFGGDTYIWSDTAMMIFNTPFRFLFGDKKKACSQEVCDGIDNDCDGKIDEGVMNTCIQYDTCNQYETCDECLETPKEICDGEDNNCNGEIDEDTVVECIEYSTCSKYTLCGSACPKTPEEICGDNIDNDCNDEIDENCEAFVCEDGISKHCGSEIGECKLGKQVCKNNKWTICNGDIYPSTEIRDNKDNDCDGEIDEDIKFSFSQWINENIFNKILKLLGVKT